ncbi:MAG: ATP-binding cassette domain-containing protein [Lachnospiraceae bacterium]
MSNMIETRDLTKAYGDFVAVSRLNLHIKRGSVYGFLGPNGAGKSTTTLKMFLGLTAHFRRLHTLPSGESSLCSQPQGALLGSIGSLIRLSPSFYGNLTGEENLDIIRRILGLPASPWIRALEAVGLTEHRKKADKKVFPGQ